MRWSRARHFRRRSFQAPPPSSCSGSDLDPEDVDDALSRVNRPRSGALAGDLRLDLYYALSRVRVPGSN